MRLRFALLLPTALAISVAASGCTQTRSICGDPSPTGGPPVIASKDAELCESARLRTIEALSRMPELGSERVGLLLDHTWQWEDASTVDGLMRLVRRDAGDEIAASIRRAIDQVEEHSRRRVRAECTDEQRCLVRGAALGARIAFDDVLQILRRQEREAREHAPPPN